MRQFENQFADLIIRWLADGASLAWCNFLMQEKGERENCQLSIVNCQLNRFA